MAHTRTDFLLTTHYLNLTEQELRAYRKVDGDLASALSDAGYHTKTNRVFVSSQALKELDVAGRPGRICKLVDYVEATRALAAERRKILRMGIASGCDQVKRVARMGAVFAGMALLLVLADAPTGAEFWKTIALMYPRIAAATAVATATAAAAGVSVAKLNCQCDLD